MGEKIFYGCQIEATSARGSVMFKCQRGHAKPGATLVKTAVPSTAGEAGDVYSNRML